MATSRRSETADCSPLNRVPLRSPVCPITQRPSEPGHATCGRAARASHLVAAVTPVQPRASQLPTRWAGRGVVSAFIVGGAVGLVVGLDANPSTAWFAVFEVGIPSAILGGLVGLVSGTIATGVTAHTGGGAARRRVHPHR